MEMPKSGDRNDSERTVQDLRKLLASCRRMQAMLDREAIDHERLNTLSTRMAKLMMKETDGIEGQPIGELILSIAAASLSTVVTLSMDSKEVENHDRIAAVPEEASRAWSHLAGSIMLLGVGGRGLVKLEPRDE